MIQSQSMFSGSCVLPQPPKNNKQVVRLNLQMSHQGDPQPKAEWQQTSAPITVSTAKLAVKWPSLRSGFRQQIGCSKYREGPEKTWYNFNNFWHTFTICPRASTTLLLLWGRVHSWFWSTGKSQPVQTNTFKFGQFGAPSTQICPTCPVLSLPKSSKCPIKSQQKYTKIISKLPYTTYRPVL